LHDFQENLVCDSVAAFLVILGIFDSAFMQFSRGNARRDFRGEGDLTMVNGELVQGGVLKSNHIVIKISHIVQKTY